MKVVSLYLCLLFAFSYNIIYRNRDTYLLHMYGINLSSFTLHDSTFLSYLTVWTRVSTEIETRHRRMGSSIP